MRTPMKPMLWALALIALPTQALAAATWCEERTPGRYNCYFIDNASCQEVQASPHFFTGHDICFTGGALQKPPAELLAFGKGRTVVMKGARGLTAPRAAPITKIPQCAPGQRPPCHGPRTPGLPVN